MGKVTFTEETRIEKSFDSPRDLELLEIVKKAAAKTLPAIDYKQIFAGYVLIVSIHNGHGHALCMFGYKHALRSIPKEWMDICGQCVGNIGVTYFAPFKGHRLTVTDEEGWNIAVCCADMSMRVWELSDPPFPKFVPHIKDGLSEYDRRKSERREFSIASSFGKILWNCLVMSDNFAVPSLSTSPLLNQEIASLIHIEREVEKYGKIFEALADASKSINRLRPEENWFDHDHNVF